MPTENNPDAIEPREPEPPASTSVSLSQQNIYLTANFEGGFPSANSLGEYGAIQADLPERIMAMAEREAAHRQEMEKTDLKGAQALALRGQVFGLVVALVGLIAALWVTLAGHPVVGGFIGTVDLVALVTVFVMGRRAADVPAGDPTDTGGA